MLEKEGSIPVTFPALLVKDVGVTKSGSCVDSSPGKTAPVNEQGIKLK
jgi:hypothetical protein